MGTDTAIEEIEVICSQCSFPVVTEYDETGNVTGFHEEDCPKEAEVAMAQGWTDHGVGLVCPKCSLSYLETLAQDDAAGVEHGPHGDIGEILDETFLKAVSPASVSPDTIAQFVRMFRTERLNRFRVLAGLQTLTPFTPVPRDDAQAQEFRDVLAALEQKRANLETQGS